MGHFDEGFGFVSTFKLEFCKNKVTYVPLPSYSGIILILWGSAF